MRKLDKFWNSAIQELNLDRIISEDGFARVPTSYFHSQGSEPRLLTKFDSFSDLPNKFQANQWSLLPDSRNGYLIGPFEIFQGLKPIDELSFKQLDPISHIESLQWESLYSEAACLNYGFASGMFEDFLGSEVVPAVSGRMTAGEFDFFVNDSKGSRIQLKANRPQIEIDAGYEGRDFLALVEAKNFQAVDFNLRQLYFPYRYWTERISKLVRPIFFSHFGDRFSIREYRFAEPTNLSSAQLIQSKSYVVGRFTFETEEILEISKSTDSSELNWVAPYPQADDVTKLIFLFENLKGGGLTKPGIASLLEIHLRQASYYGDALRFLDLVESENPNTVGQNYRLNRNGLKIASMDSREIKREFARRMLCIPALNIAFQMIEGAKGYVPESRLAELVNEDSFLLEKGTMSGETTRRRSKTISSWLNWVVALTPTRQSR